jgi:hypothetical protein
LKKWLLYIMLAITATGSFFPCCAPADDCEEQTETGSHSEQHQPEGNCSPFFACATCPGSVEMAKTFFFILPVKERQDYFSQIEKSNLLTFFPSFWQPPRFS